MSFILSKCIVLTNLLLKKLDTSFHNHGTIDVTVKPVNYSPRSAFEVRSNLASNLVVSLNMDLDSDCVLVRMEDVGEDRDEFVLDKEEDVGPAFYKIVAFLTDNQTV